MDRSGRQAAALAIAGILSAAGCASTAGTGSATLAATAPVPNQPAPRPNSIVVPAPIPLPGPPVLADPSVAVALRERWGVEIVGIRPTAAGTMIDFRYRVIDPDKALPLLDRTTKATLVIEASGEELAVPVPPKVGPMRQTVRYEDARAGRVYFIFFANPGRRVTAGEKVSVVIGEFRAEHLIVQ